MSQPKVLLVTMNAKGEMKFSPVDREQSEKDQYAQETKRHLTRVFALDDAQYGKYKGWVYEQDVKVAKKQNRQLPYYGCSGGAYEFSFTPSGLGVIIKVKNVITNETIDLTDYDM